VIVAVIDLGKTNSKVALVDTALAKEIEVVTQKASVKPQGIYPAIDHELIERFVVSSLSELSKHHSIDAITVTTHGATAALLDDSGELALPVLDYEFRGVDDSREEYNQHRPLFAETGSPALPGGLNIGAQMYWQQLHFPALFSKVKTVLTWPQYWVHLLTGKQVNDVTSLGCHTDLYEPNRQQYSTLVDKMNWRSLMPPTVHSGQLNGTLLPSVASATGLSPDTPVYTGIHDSNASLVPHLITQKAPFTVVSTGTWLIAMAIEGKENALDENRDTLLNVNAHGQAVPSARFMGGRERDLSGVSTPATNSTLNQLLGSADPPMQMPSVVADTGPFPHCSPTWLNVTENSELSHCAVTLYLALMTHECMQLVGSRGATYIEGPLAHDEHFAQMLAAVSDRPVFVSDSQTGTSVGAAMLISNPEVTSPYTEVNLSKERRLQMATYASLWQNHLQDHAK